MCKKVTMIFAVFMVLLLIYSLIKWPSYSGILMTDSVLCMTP